MITVIHVRNSNYPGGVETTLLGWVKEANREAFNHRLFIFAEPKGIHLRSARVMRDQGLDSEVLPWGVYKNLFGAVKQLVGEIRRSPNPIVHSHDTRADVVGLLAARITKVPFVISNHAWHAVGFKRWLLEFIRAQVMRFADFVINVSEDTHKETVRRGIDPAKSITIYSGIDLSVFLDAPDKSSARASLDIDPGDFVIGDIARLWPEKAIDKLLDATSLLLEKHPNVKTLIVGDGPLEQELIDYAKARGLESHVRFLGFREDVANLLSAFDVFALPSSAEGTPMVIYSAMAMALPIVASACSGVAEVLEDKRTALLCPPADAKAIAAAISSIIEDPDLGSRLGAEAKQAVFQNYSAEQAIRKLEDLYRRLAHAG